MDGRLIEQIRRADRTVESAHDASSNEPCDAQTHYRFAPKLAGRLAEPPPAAFASVSSNQQFFHVGNPAVVLAKADHNGLPGADVLEALFYVADPAAECRQAAEQALQAFGSVGAVLSADIHDLITRLGINDRIAYALKAIHAGMRSVLREPIRERIVIGSFATLIDYVGLNLRHEPIEILRVLYLDRKNGLISDEEAGRGTVDHVPLYPREIVKRALELGASAVILAHNHPSGDPTPSDFDVTMSQEVQRALSVMNIALHDSLIIGRDGFASLRGAHRL